MPLSELIGSEQIFFTKEEYLKNLRYTKELLAAEESYALIIKAHAFHNIFLCVKKGVGIFITKITGASEAFYIDQADIVELVWVFLQELIDEDVSQNQKRVLHELEELEEKLR